MRFKTIDVEQGSRAKSLNYAHMNLTVPELFFLFGNIVNTNTQLQSLDLSNTTLGAIGIDLLIGYFGVNRQIESLHLNGCQLNHSHIKDLLQAIKAQCPNLTTLSLENNSFDDGALLFLARFAKENPLIKLKFSTTSVREDDQLQGIYSPMFDDLMAIRRTSLDTTEQQSFVCETRNTPKRY
jgi:Ran GTPase-activating protein (RanGAP) involved in mRNA processing and transport